jgi:hypothetical protein
LEREIADKQKEQERSVLRYQRLRDEMDKLIAPLYFATLTVKDLKGDKEGDKGYFDLVDPAYRWEPKWMAFFAFWDGIKKNTCLSRDEEFSKELMALFSLYDAYFIKGKGAAEKHNYENKLDLLKQKNEGKHPILKQQLQDVEKDLKIGVFPVKANIGSESGMEATLSTKDVN